jgi:hypothetical protein
MHNLARNNANQQCDFESLVKGVVKTCGEMSCRSSMGTGHRLSSHKSSKDAIFRAAPGGCGEAFGEIMRTLVGNARLLRFKLAPEFQASLERYGLWVAESDLHFVAIHDMVDFSRSRFDNLLRAPLATRRDRIGIRTPQLVSRRMAASEVQNLASRKLPGASASPNEAAAGTETR